MVARHVEQVRELSTGRRNPRFLSSTSSFLRHIMATPGDEETPPTAPPPFSTEQVAWLRTAFRGTSGLPPGSDSSGDPSATRTVPPTGKRSMLHD